MRVRNVVTGDRSFAGYLAYPRHAVNPIKGAEKARDSSSFPCVRQASVSEQPARRNGNRLLLPNNQMIQDPHVDKAGCFHDSPGQRAVCRTRFGDAGWMIVGKDDRGGVKLQARLNCFARMDGCAVD